VPDGVSKVWAGRHEKILIVIGRLPHLEHEIMLGDSDVFLIGVIRLLAVVIVVVASSNYAPLEALLLPLLTAYGASLSTFVESLGCYPLAIARDRLPITLDEDGPDHVFTRGVPCGNVK
jgi:hypothetical protein